ncbi:MAG: hypothetical protein ACR2QC_05635 [Gammaproteobacteria bacterium]
MFTLIFRFNHPSHSCEGRNLRRRKAAGNCTITAFGVEIPAFAGMGRSLSLAFAGMGLEGRRKIGENGVQ